MTLTVNGRLLNMNIGCRTFTSISKLMDLLGVKEQLSSIELNGQSIDRTNFASTSVSTGDKLVFSDNSIAQDKEHRQRRRQQPVANKE
jgi:sulfur carrier protein ThiS